MRLTEEEILSIAREHGLEWYLPDFARRIERAVLEKAADEADEIIVSDQPIASEDADAWLRGSNKTRDTITKAIRTAAQEKP